MNYERRNVKKTIFAKHVEFLGIKFKDLPKDLLDNDIIEIFEAGTEDDWFGHQLYIHRYIPEPDDEYEERIKRLKQLEEKERKERRIQYETLKSEFEP